MRVVTVVVVAVCCLVSCASDPLSGCSKLEDEVEADGSLDCSQQDLSRAYLKDADLTGADLTGADLTEAYLKDAYLTGADLTGAELTGAYLTGALADENTTWPEGFHPEGLMGQVTEG